MRLLRGLLVALVLAALPASPALAHAVLQRTDPLDLCLASFVSESVCGSGMLLSAPPQNVHLWFTEPVQPFAGGITVNGPSGKPVQRDGVQIDGTQLSVAVDAAEAGTYLVTWRVITADTHPVRGQFAFSVGQASATTGAPVESSIGAVSALGLVLQVAARWLHFAGYALAFGALGFRVWIIDGGSVTNEFVTAGRGAGRPSTMLRMHSGERTWTAAPRRIARLIGFGLLCLLAAEPLALLGQTASVSAAAMLDPAIVGGALDSSFGRALALRLGAALWLWVLLGVEKDGARIATPLALGAGGALALVDGTAAHAVSLRPEWLGLTVNALHLCAMAIWLGGIAALLALWGLPEMAVARTALLARFTPIAATALGVVVVSGILMTGAHQALPFIGVFGTYSVAAFAKFALLSVAAGLAALALWRPRLHPERWWLAETVVLAVAGLLVSLPPPV